MFDARRRGKEGACKPAPELEGVGVAKRYHVVVYALPQNAEAVLCRIFDDALQRHAVAAFGRPERGRRFGNGSFEGDGIGGVDCDMSDFCDHQRGMPRGEARGKA